MSPSTPITRRQLIAGAGAAAAFQQFGCASPVPGGNGLAALSGKSLQVQLMFAGNINPNYYYYFLMNNSNSSVGPYAVPVGSPIGSTGYGNGFATGSDGQSAGFTDFVLFSNNQYSGSQPNQGFGLYHVANSSGVNGGNSSANFVANGSPLQVFSPLTSGSLNVIAFNLDLAQLFEYPNSTISQSSAINMARNLQWVQINMVATDVVPVDITTTVTKHFDSFGDDANGAGSFLLANLLDGPGTYANTSSTSLTEPQGDVYVSPGGGVTSAFPQLDLVGWQVVIVTNS